jgi:TetR/AcrR family transcriptional regulator, tetracycline repressor protein
MAELVKTQRRRRPRGSLSREQVVEAALALADESGLAGLTMPALAGRLDCGVMTLYGYIESKKELLEAVVQLGMQDLHLPRPLPGDAAGVLLAWGRTLRATLLRHPVLPAIFLDQPVIGPGILRGVEALLGALSRTGYPTGEGVHAIYSVLIYVVGFVGWELPRTRNQPEATYASAWRQVAAGLPAVDFPLATTVLDELGAVAGETQFELGLAALVAGLMPNIAIDDRD